MNINGLMVESGLANGKIISFMDMLKCIMKMEGHTKGIGSKIRNMGKVCMFGPMVRSMMGCG